MDKQNGIITEYSIKYTAVDGEDDKPHEILGIPSDTTKYLLEQLEKWTEYRITVTAHTDVGPGPESLSVFTILYWFLSYINITQPWVYICALPLEPPSYLSTYPTPHRALV